MASPLTLSGDEMTADVAAVAELPPPPALFAAAELRRLLLLLLLDGIPPSRPMPVPSDDDEVVADEFIVAPDALSFSLWHDGDDDG